MKTLNNKYLIEECIEIEENFLSYKISDIFDNQKYNICILKNDFEYKNSREYLLSKFKTVKSLNFNNIVNLIDIEVIKNIDGINLDKVQYGYITENIDYSIDVEDYLKKATFNNRLDIFMELCAAVNTLNTKGYVFKSIDFKDLIIVLNKDKKNSIKIKNLLKYEISKFNMNNLLNIKSLIYPYSLEKHDYQDKDNIKEILCLFKLLFNEKEIIDNNFEENISSFKKEHKISGFIQYINRKLNKNYNIFIFEALNKIETDLDIIGMKEEIKKVDISFKYILENKLNYKIISFNGEDGTGKTRTIKEIKYKIYNKYFINKLEKPYLLIDNLDDGSSCISMLEKIYNNLDKYLKDKYGVYIKKFIEMLSETEIINNENTLQVINRICKLFNEYTLNTTLIILVDNLEKSHKIFKLLFKYLCSVGNKLENIMIIFSFNEENFDFEMNDLLNEFRNLKNYEEYKVNYFNNYNTNKMVKRMLTSSKCIDELCMKIYSETLGKPRFIYETIKELYNNGTLYVCKYDGLWKSKIDISNIVIPKNIEKTLENKILGLNSKEINILECLSIYDSALSEMLIISKIFPHDEQIGIYYQLKLKRFLIDKISDIGIRIDFYNDLVKKIIYSKINLDKKIIMHNKSSKILEEVLYKTDEYLDEFLNQLEKSMQWEKLIKYSLKCGKKYDILGDTFQAIDYYKKALKYEQNENKCRISISIAKLNEKVGQDKEAYKYFDKANTYAVKNSDHKLQIYVLLKIIIIKIKECNYTNLNAKLQTVRELLNKVVYPKGEAYYYYACALLAKIEEQSQKSLNYLDTVFKICNDNNINVGVYAWAKLLISKIYTNQGKYNEIKYLLKEPLDIFTKENNYVGILSTKIYYQLVKKECGEDLNKVLDNIKEINKFSNKYKVYKKEVSSLIEIAKIYIENREYDNANKNLFYALEISREHSFDRYILRICNLLCWSYSKLGNLRLATNYYNLTLELKKGIKLFEVDILNLKMTSALYNCLVHNFSYAIKEMEDVDILIRNNQSFENCKLRCQYYKLKILECKDEKTIQEIFLLLIKETDRFRNIKIKNSILINVIKFILDFGYKELAKNLFLDIIECSNDYDTEMEYVYLELNFRYKNCYNILINKALRTISLANNKDMKANLYCLIGEKYEEMHCYELAVNYYYESINIFINVINCLHEKEKKIYLNNSKFLISYNKFRNCLIKLLDISIDLKEINFINNDFEINKLLDELKIYNLLKNKEFHDLMKKFYNKCYYNSVTDMFSILKNFSNDIIKNLEILLKYMARITLANKAMIVMENEFGKNEVICEYRISDNNEIQKYFSLKVDAAQDVLIICNNDDKINSMDDEILQYGMKACMYVNFSNKGKLINNNDKINGKLILISDNAINYINEESKSMIEKMIPFIMFLLDQYKLRISSTLDKLTGVYNRKHLETSLKDLIDYSYEKSKEFSLVIFDIDDFKDVNDSYGHQTGDEVLIRLTNEVKKCLSNKDIFVRYGGEEFILLLPNKGEKCAYKLTEKIRKQVEQAKILGDKRKVTISLGIAVYRQHSFDSEDLIKKADVALYASKDNGKNQVTIWNEELNELNKSNYSNGKIKSILLPNYTKDYNQRLITREIMEIIKTNNNLDKKIYMFISPIIQTIGAECVSVFIIKDEKISKTYNKKRYKEDGYKIKDFNMNLVNEVIEDSRGQYLIDWSNTYTNDSYGIPDWKSLCIVPLINNGEVIAVIYASISVNEKEFTQDDVDLVEYFGQLAISLFL